jgi:hypothetical protein
LYLERDNVSDKIDPYEIDGDTPNIDTVFFIKLNEVKNLNKFIGGRPSISY